MITNTYDGKKSLPKLFLNNRNSPKGVVKKIKRFLNFGYRGKNRKAKKMNERINSIRAFISEYKEPIEYRGKWCFEIQIDNESQIFGPYESEAEAGIDFEECLKLLDDEFLKGTPAYKNLISLC